MAYDFSDVGSEVFAGTKPEPEADVETNDSHMTDAYSVNINPSNEAEVSRLSSESGIDDVDYVRKNFEAINYTNHRAKLRRSLEDKPQTKYLFDNVINESWAAGDYDQLGAIEGIIRDVKQGWQQGSAIDDIGGAGWDQMMSNGPLDKYNESVAPTRAQLSRGRTGELNWISGVPGSVTETVPMMIGMIPEVAAFGAAGAGTGAAAGTVVPGAGTVGGAITGGAWGMRVGAGYAMGKLEAGAAYDEYIQMTDVTGKAMSHDAAKGAALIVGVANGLLEMASIERIARTIPGAEKFLGRITNKNMKTLLGHPTMQNAVANFGARMTSVTLGEGAIEALQEVITLGGELIAAGQDGGDYESPTLRQAGEVAWSAFRQGTQAGFGLGLPGNIVTGYYEAKAASITNANIKAVELINSEAQNIDALKSQPSKVKEAVKNMQELYGSTDAVYIDPEALNTFFQEAGVDEAQIQAEMPETYAQIVEARASGGNVAVPLGDYITFIAPAKNAASLLNDTKFNPDDLTANELKNVQQEIADLQEQSIEGEPQTDIFQKIQAQLVEVGQAPEAAAQMALLWESTFESFGERLPMSAQEFFDQFQVQIQREKDATEGLNVFEQDTEGTPAYEAALAKFGPEGMTTEARMARAKEQGYGVEFYHGSPTLKEDGAVDLDYEQRTDAGYLGKALYGTEYEFIAKAYSEPMGSGPAGDVLRLVTKAKSFKDFLYDENYKQKIADFGQEIGVEAEPHTPEWSVEFAEKMQDAGYEGARGLTEDGGVTEIAIFNPTNIRSVNAAFDPDMADSDNLLFQDESAYATAQTLVDAPRITLQDLVGKKVQFIMADLTAAGSVYSGLDGIEVDPIPLLGGPGFPLQQVYSDAGVAWVFRGAGKATRVLNNMNDKGADLVIVMAMDQNAHRSNSTVAKAMVDTFDAAQAQGRISAENMELIAGEIHKVKAYPKLAQFPGFVDAKATHKWLDSLTFDERAAVAKVLESKRVQKIDGVPNLTRMLNAVRETGFNGVNLGDSLMALELTGERVQFREEGIPLHPDYEMGLKGKAVGSFAQPINWNILLEDKFKELGKPINAFNVDRIGPLVDITQEMADKAALVEGLQTPTAALASMAAALSGNWSDTQTAVNKGGVSPKMVEDAIKASPAQATLTKYTAKDISSGAKDGSLVFHRLGQSEAYFGIAKGYNYKDVYGFDHPDMTENETALVGVVNNTQGASGLGPAQVLRAIELGVTSLDAFSVISDKHPSGFLPEFYGIFGFEKVGEVAFDEQYYSPNEIADLKAGWKANGWDESSGYPPVAIMKWRGKESERSDATVKFIGKDYNSSDWSNLDGETSQSIESATQQAAGQKEARAGDGARDSGSDQNNTDRFTSRLVAAISDLQSLPPEVASLYGVTNESIQKINERFGTILYQSKAAPRGYIQFNDLRDYFTITLTGKANLSTFLHESGHFFLEMMQVASEVEGADASLKSDLAILYDWMGASPGQKLQVEHHEKFARGFEAYLMEGNAPNAKVAAAFERFKGWLVRIYKSIQALNAPLTDEVRGVMDRLVGVDQGFIQLRGEYRPLFTSADEANMTEAQYAKYLEQYNAYMNDAQIQVEREVINDVLKQRTAEYNERKKELTKEVGEELDNEQVYRVRRFLSGQWGRDNPNFAHFPDYLFGHKLDTQSVKDLMGEVPPKLRGMVESDSAMTPDEIAPLFGYESGMAMLEELNSTPARGDAIFDRVDSRLEEEFGDIILDGKLEEESINAIHSGEMSDFIAGELKNIGQKAGVATTKQKQIARHVARERVLSIPILALNRSKFIQAEKRAARNAAKAMQEGNWMKAAEHKLQQLVAHYMYKEATDAQKKAEAHRKALVRYTKAPRQKALAKAGEHYLDAINALLDGVELTARSGKQLRRRTSLKEFMDEQAAAGNDVFIPQELQDTAKLKNYRQMSLSELTSLRDTVDHIASTARLKNMIKTKQGRQKLAEVVNTLVNSMEENAKGNRNEVDSRDINKRNLPEWITSSLVKPEFLMKWIDGETAGYAHSAIFNPLAEAQHKENDMLAEIAGMIKPLTDSLDQKRMSATVTIHGEAYTREQAFAIALNMGNRGNLKKLLAGRNWDETTLVRDIQKALTKQDFEVVQGIWDSIDTLWPEIKRVAMDAGMGRPPRVEASELELQDIGITLRGGYYPIVYDPRHAETLAYKQNIQIADSIFENNLFNGGVSSGFKEARVEIKRPPPLLLSLNVLSNHTGEVIHFITHYEAVKQAEKIITAPAFASQFKDSFGSEYHKALKNWLKDIANQGARNEDLTFAPAMSQYLRIGMSMVAMGFSLSTMMMQGFGTLTTVDEIGLSYTLKGLRKAMNPTIYKDVIAMSGEIRHITKNMDREIADTLNASFDTNKVTRAMRPIKNFAFMHIAYAQRVVNVAAFEGAREQALDQGKSHEESMQYADAVVRMTQSGAGFKDLARIQGGNEFLKLFTPFYTYFSVLYNRYQDAAREVSLKPMSWVNFSQRMMWLMFIPVYAEILMRGEEPEEDEDWLSWFMVKNIEYAVTTLPFIREGVKLATSDYAPNPVAAMDIFKDLARTKSTAGKLIFEGYDWGDLTLSQQRNVVETVATLTHMPTKTPWRFYEAIVDDTVEDPVRHILMGSGRPSQ